MNDGERRFFSLSTGMTPEYGISLYPGTGTADGRRGDHILLAPAYNVTEADTELIVELAARVVVDFFAERNFS